ncbi:hypothetical protein SAMN04487981_103263 [Streptomyces sp. cf386]|uniref:hypothetical protein n=1 Tax=Streptomyces sp. cf386 TaxID=1761904 RepID=UPI000890DA38|nr:hypothetical protein [Streptomyces sp. cf386]SDN01585.1 hypothetical protein SAMN04487981_103263 [Streptomyces sp. cf386]
MHPQTHPHHETDACVEDLRAALEANGITLPSLGVDLPTFADSLPTRPLIALGNCNQVTARALISALRKAAGR